MEKKGYCEFEAVAGGRPEPDYREHLGLHAV